MIIVRSSATQPPKGVLRRGQERVRAACSAGQVAVPGHLLLPAARPLTPPPPPSLSLPHSRTRGRRPEFEIRSFHIIYIRVSLMFLPPGAPREYSSLLPIWSWGVEGTNHSSGRKNQSQGHPLPPFPHLPLLSQATHESGGGGAAATGNVKVTSRARGTV